MRKLLYLEKSDYGSFFLAFSEIKNMKIGKRFLFKSGILIKNNEKTTKTNQKHQLKQQN